MTEKELKKLNRQELLEVLLAQSRKIDRLQRQLQETNDKLAEKKIAISEAGSIAEASLALNGVFAAAQKAADQYLDNLRRMNEQLEKKHSNAEEETPQRDSESAAGVSELIEQTEKECAALREMTVKECSAMREQAERDVEQKTRELLEMTERSESECAAMRVQTQKECAEIKARADKQIRYSLIRTKQIVRQMIGLYAGEIEKRMRRLQKWERQTGAMHERKKENQSS